MSALTQLELAGIPAVVAAMKALQAFNANVGTDPAKWPATVPGAQAIALGTLLLQIPLFEISEVGALQGIFDSKLSATIAALEAKLDPPSPPQVVTPPVAPQLKIS